MTKPQLLARNVQAIQIESTEPLWTVDDVASYLRLNPETVRHMARIHKIPGIKIGKVWRFRAEKVKDWLLINGDPINTTS